MMDWHSTRSSSVRCVIGLDLNVVGAAVLVLRSACLVLYGVIVYPLTAQRCTQQVHACLILGLTAGLCVFLQSRAGRHGRRSDHHDKHGQQQQGRPPRGPLCGPRHGFYGSSLGKSYTRPGGGWRPGGQVRLPDMVRSAAQCSVRSCMTAQQVDVQCVQDSCSSALLCWLQSLMCSSARARDVFPCSCSVCCSLSCATHM